MSKDRAPTFTREDIVSMLTAASLPGEEVSCWDEDDYWGNTTVRSVEASGDGRVTITLHNGQMFDMTIREHPERRRIAANDNHAHASVVAA